MISLVKTLRCPYCDVPVSKELLKTQGSLKAYLNRKEFPCPHCTKAIKLPENAESLVSIGLFTAVILAPLLHVWRFEGLNPLYAFGIGCALIVLGMSKQKLVKS
ncbi:hypothetical protein [Sessilibacter sp. MAH2]